MPFTISHAAAVLPFARPLARWRLLSAAVIGSMVPDFGWFLPWPWRPPRFETHSPFSLLMFSLPVGLAAYWLFQRVIKTPLIELLPDAAYLRWRKFAAPADLARPREWLLAVCGVLGGALTHLGWDAFTHNGARGMRIFPSLDDPRIAFGGHQLMGARLLEDASSLSGLLVVIALCAYALRSGERLPPGERRVSAPERRAWIGAYLALAALFTAALFLLKPGSMTRGWMLPASSLAVALLRASAAALLIVSLAVKRRLRVLDSWRTRSFT